MSLAPLARPRCCALAVATVALLAAIPRAHAGVAGPTAANAPANAPANTSASPSDAVLLMPLSSLGSTEEAAKAMEHVITAEAQKLLGPRLRRIADLEAEGAHVSDALRACDGAPTCLVEVVGGLGWSAIVVGSVSGLGEQRVINMRALDARSGAALGKVEIPASGEEHQLIAQIRRALVELVAPDLYVGALEITAPQDGVQILVDGQLLATTPLPTNRITLPVGRHALEARGEGLVSFSQLVDIAYEQTNRVTVDLPVNTVFVGGDTPFRSRWYTWAIAGAGVVGLGLGGYFNSLQHETSDRIEARARAGSLTVDDSRLFVEERDHWTRAKVFYGIGAALLTGVGVLLTLDL